MISTWTLSEDRKQVTVISSYILVRVMLDLFLHVARPPFLVGTFTSVHRLTKVTLPKTLFELAQSGSSGEATTRTWAKIDSMSNIVSSNLHRSKDPLNSFQPSQKKRSQALQRFFLSLKSRECSYTLDQMAHIHTKAKGTFTISSTWSKAQRTWHSIVLWTCQGSQVKTISSYFSKLRIKNQVRAINPRISKGHPLKVSHRSRWSRETVFTHLEHLNSSTYKSKRTLLFWTSSTQYHPNRLVKQVNPCQGYLKLLYHIKNRHFKLRNQMQEMVTKQRPDTLYDKSNETTYSSWVARIYPLRWATIPRLSQAILPIRKSESNLYPSHKQRYSVERRPLFFDKVARLHLARCPS